MVLLNLHYISFKYQFTSYIVPQVSFDIIFSDKFQMWKCLFFSFLFFFFFFLGGGEEIWISLIFLKILIKVIKKGLQIFAISDLRERQNDECWKLAKSYNEFPIKQQFIIWISIIHCVHYGNVIFASLTWLQILHSSIFWIIRPEGWITAYFRPMVHFYTPPSRHLLIQSQQWKHQNNAWNLFKIQ